LAIRQPNFNVLAGFAARPGGALGLTTASQLVVDGINHMALAHGFIDPRDGIRVLRNVFGLDPATGMPLVSKESKGGAQM
jgi:hypothetical protein